MLLPLLDLFALAPIIPVIQAFVLRSSTNSSVPTLNATSTPNKASATSNTFKLSFVNFLESTNVHAYVTGQDSSGNLFILKQDGSDWMTPEPGTKNITGIDIPLRSDQTPLDIALPSVIYSARVWVAEGYLNFSTTSNAATGGIDLVQPLVNPQDSSIDTNWGFAEFSYNASDARASMTADLSYVDFVGLPRGIALNDSTTSQTKLGLKSTAVKDICNDLQTKPPSDGQPWIQLCINGTNGKPLRVLSPIHLKARNTSAFSNYFTPYLTRVWPTYSTTPLNSNTQSPLPHQQDPNLHARQHHLHPPQRHHNTQLRQRRLHHHPPQQSRSHTRARLTPVSAHPLNRGRMMTSAEQLLRKHGVFLSQ